MVAMGPLVANHFGAKFGLIAWTGAGILREGRPLALLSAVAGRHRAPKGELAA